MKRQRYNPVKDYWDGRRQRQTALRKEGLVSTLTVQGRIHVVTPYDREFIRAAMTLGGHWMKRSQCWSIPVENRAALENVLHEIFGWKPGGLTDRMIAGCNHRYLRGVGGTSICLHCGQPEPSEP